MTIKSISAAFKYSSDGYMKYIKYALSGLVIIILVALLWITKSTKQGFQNTDSTPASTTDTPTTTPAATTPTLQPPTTTPAATTPIQQPVSTTPATTTPTQQPAITKTVEDLNLEAVGTKITGAVQPIEGSPELDKQITDGPIGTNANINPPSAPVSLIQSAPQPVSTLDNTAPITSTTEAVIPTEPSLFNFRFVDLSQSPSASLYRK
jgi:hypothetical protein